jgi:hypothetical protein
MRSAPVARRQDTEGGRQRRGVDLIVRERGAAAVLEHAGVRREIVTADPRCSFGTAAARAPRGAWNRRPIGMSVREPGVAAPDLDVNSYHALLANAADFMVDRFDADVVFVPMERSVLDTQHSHAVIAKMLRAQRATVLKGEYTSGQLLSLMGKFDFALGMRLHFLILPPPGTPFVRCPTPARWRLSRGLNLPAPPTPGQPGRRSRLDEWDRRAASMRTHRRRAAAGASRKA